MANGFVDLNDPKNKKMVAEALEFLIAVQPDGLPDALAASLGELNAKLFMEEYCVRKGIGYDALTEEDAWRAFCDRKYA